MNNWEGTTKSAKQRIQINCKAKKTETKPINLQCTKK